MPPTPVPRETPDITAERLAQLRELFPEAFSEGQVDFDKLRAALGDLVDDQRERYSFTWAGKTNAIRILQTPTRATLIPCPEQSLEFDTTQNLFIEGDNLEVLKLLYKPYFGRVKMIYIDPPYNTGNDFVYPDNYADPLDTYLKLTGQRDAEGNLLTTNPETSGRYHSAWLSMMYPRLFLARQLLREDGVIFVSIDDNEVHNLRMLMNEVFGEENFVANVIWQKKQSPQNDATYFSDMHDHVLVYARRARTNAAETEGWTIAKFPMGEAQTARYKNADNDPRGPWASADCSGNKTADQRPNLYYPVVNPHTSEDVWPTKQRAWLFERSTMEKLIADGRIWWGEDGRNFPRAKRFLSEATDGVVPGTVWLRTEAGDNQEAAREIRSAFAETYGVFDTPKPTRLIRRMLQTAISPDTEDLILDFFAGSCTTAQAVLELNREDGGNRRFIMVQLPEPTGREDFPTIADIGKERIRRVVARMREADAGKLDLPDRATPEDLGFRVFKLAPTNLQPWTHPATTDAEAVQAALQQQLEPLLEGWTEPGVIAEVALKEGFGLNYQVTLLEEVATNSVHRLTDPDKGQSLFVCLDERLSDETWQALDLKPEDLFVCRDRALTDTQAANLALQCRLHTL